MAEVSVFDALAEYNPSFNTKKTLKVCYVIFGITAICCSAALVDVSNGWSNDHFQFKSGPSSFYNETADCLYIAIGQFLILPLIAWVAIEFATEKPIKSDTDSPKRCDCFRCFYRIGKRYNISTTNYEEEIIILCLTEIYLVISAIANHSTVKTITTEGSRCFCEMETSLSPSG